MMNEMLSRLMAAIERNEDHDRLAAKLAALMEDGDSAEKVTGLEAVEAAYEEWAVSEIKAGALDTLAERYEV
jgi:hypothetical protein